MTDTRADGQMTANAALAYHCVAKNGNKTAKINAKNYRPSDRVKIDRQDIFN